MLVGTASASAIEQLPAAALSDTNRPEVPRRAVEALPQVRRTVSTPEPLQVTSALTAPAAVENGTDPVVNGGASRPLAVAPVSVVDCVWVVAGVSVVADLGLVVGVGVVGVGDRAVVPAGLGAVIVVDVVVVLALVIVVAEPPDVMCFIGTCFTGTVVLVGGGGSRWCRLR